MAVDENEDSKIITNLNNGDNIMGTEGVSGLDQSDSDVNLARKFQEEVLSSAKTNLASSQIGYGSSSLSSGSVNLNLAESKPLVNAEKPLLRRKSELPTDQYTQNALESHKRADEYLSTPPPDTN
jgi:hypothetical protein